MHDDLHTRLVAALTARLERARAATPGPWQVAADGEVETVRGDYGTPGYPLHLRVTQDAEGISAAINPEDAAYVAANDPATEIRRVEATLRVLERHRPDEYGDCSTCAEWRDDEDPDGSFTGHAGAVRAPCSTIRDLAEGEGIEVGDE